MGVRKGGFINNHPPAWLRVLWLLLGPLAFFHVLSWVMYRLSTGSIRLWLVGKGFQICRINCLPPPLYLSGTLVGSLTLQALFLLGFLLCSPVAFCTFHHLAVPVSFLWMKSSIQAYTQHVFSLNEFTAKPCMSNSLFTMLSSFSFLDADGSFVFLSSHRDHSSFTIQSFRKGAISNCSWKVVACVEIKSFKGFSHCIFLLCWLSRHFSNFPWCVFS